MKQMPTQELQQVMSALKQELKGRQDASLEFSPGSVCSLSDLAERGGTQDQYPQAFCLQWGDGQVGGVF